MHPYIKLSPNTKKRKQKKQKTPMLFTNAKRAYGYYFFHLPHYMLTNTEAALLRKFAFVELTF